MRISLFVAIARQQRRLLAARAAARQAFQLLQRWQALTLADDQRLLGCAAVLYCRLLALVARFLTASAALARALAADPAVLLLDEPLSALDPTTRAEVRAGLAHRLAGFDGVTVLVTHDPLDALTLADRLVFVEGGRVVQSGPPAEVVARPRDAYVAHVVGLNLYAGETRSQTLVETSVGPVVTSGHDHAGPSWVSFAPAAVSLYPARPGGSPRNAWACTVRAVEIVGQTARVRLREDVTGEPVVAEVTTASVAELRLQTGTTVWATVKATEVTAYPA